MELEATVISTAVNFGALAYSKINKSRRKHDKSTKIWEYEKPF